MRAIPIATAILLISATTACAQNAQDTPAGFRDEFLHQFDNSMTRVIALAEAVPAETYARRAVPAVQPLGQIFAHIAQYNYEYPARAMGIAPPAGIDRDTLERVAEKAKVVALLRSSASTSGRSCVACRRSSSVGRRRSTVGRCPSGRCSSS